MKNAKTLKHASLVAEVDHFLHSFRVYVHIFSTRFECIFTSSHLVSSVVFHVSGVLLSQFGVGAITPQDLKKRVDSLLDRDYLKRDDKDPALYHYMA